MTPLEIVFATASLALQAVAATGRSAQDRNRENRRPGLARSPEGERHRLPLRRPGSVRADARPPFAGRDTSLAAPEVLAEAPISNMPLAFTASP